MHFILGEGIFEKLNELVMRTTEKPAYETPVIRLIEMNLEVNFTFSDLTIIPPYEDEQDW